MIGFKEMELNPDDAVVKAILAQQIGGVILFDKDVPSRAFDRNIKSPQQLKHLTEQLQEYTTQTARNNHNDLSPIFIGIDYEGGKVNRLKEEYGFFKTLSEAETGKGSDEQAEKYAKMMAETLQENGINMNFAPVVDVNVNPDS